MTVEARGRGQYFAVGRASWRSWWLPASWVVLACVVAVYFGSPLLDGSGDPDFYWHMLYAKWMLLHRSIPDVDFISWTFDGQPYLLTQWLGQLLVGVAFMEWGSFGSSTLTLASVAATVVLAWRTARLDCDNTLVAFLVAATCTSALWSTYARPQMFSFVAMAALVLICERAKRDDWSMGKVLLCAAVMCAWVNVHGSYVVGLVYLLMLGVAEVLHGWFDGEPRSFVLDRLQDWSITFGASTLATLVNPNGWKAWLYVIEIAGLQSTTSGVILEWAPTSFGTAVGSSYIVLLLGTMMAMSISRHRPGLNDLVMVAGMGLFGLMASRQAFYALIALVPLLSRAVDGTSIGELAKRQLVDRINVWIAIAAVAFFAGVGVLANGVRSHAADAWKKKIFPVEAVEFIKTHGVSGRIFNESTSGGYLAYATGRKIYVDGRMDLYKDKHFFEWFFARMGAPSWERTLAEAQADVFVLQQQSALTQLLLQSGKYALVHSDGSYVVVVPRDARYQDLIARSSAKRPKFRIFDEEGTLVVSPIGF